MRLSRPLPRVALALFVLTAAASAQTNPGETPILHEFVKIETSAGGRPFLPGDRGASDLPRGISYKDEILPQPSGAPDPGSEPDFIPDDETFKPDDRTEKEGVLSYKEVFSPAIAPHKRSRAFDAVLPDGTLGIAQDELRPIPIIGNQADPERDRFYASLDLNLAANTPSAIPSVSAESRILSYKTTPTVALRFAKDSADNYFVIPDKSAQVKLVFLTDAPKSYFGGPVPKARVEDIPAAMRPKLDPTQRAKAQSVFSAAGLRRGETDIESILNSLVFYFRSFEAGEFEPRPDGDRYLELALSQRGVCRHRAYAFAYTAQAAGIPTRYLFNEAHAWVEVFLPGAGWRRIDLGGAAEGIDISGGRGKPLYEPEATDPFAQPPTLDPASGAGAGAGGGAAGPNAEGAQLAASGFGNVSGLRRSGASGASGEVALAPEAEGPSESETPGEENAPPPNEALPAPPALTTGSVPVSLQLVSAPSTTFRGNTLKVSGRAAGPEGPAARLRVEVGLQRANGYLPLGATVTDAEGNFTGEFLVPTELDQLGLYDISLRTPGDATYAPSGR